MPLDINVDRAIKPKSVLFGHVRLGIFNGRHPEQSKTFIFTAKDPERLKPLQRDLGGTIERYTPQGAGEEPWKLTSDAEAFNCLPAFPTFETTVERQPIRSREDSPEERRVLGPQIEHRRNVVSRDQEQMCGCLRADVLDRD